MKRIDLAINDHTGILDIPELAKNAENGNISESPEVISFTSRASLLSTERTTENIWDTLYLGSLKSDVYFCIYEKDYEQ